MNECYALSNSPVFFISLFIHAFIYQKCYQSPIVCVYMGVCVVCACSEDVACVCAGLVYVGAWCVCGVYV